MKKQQKVTLWLETEEQDLLCKNLTPLLQELLSNAKIKMTSIDYDLVQKENEIVGSRWEMAPACFSS